MTLYAEPDESSDMLFHYYSGTVAEVLEVQRAWIRVRIGQGEAALEGWVPCARADLFGAYGGSAMWRTSFGGTPPRRARTGGLRCAGPENAKLRQTAAERNYGSERESARTAGCAELVRQRAW